MTVREQIVVKILLLVARIVSGDEELAGEIRALGNHIAARPTGE